MVGRPPLPRGNAMIQMTTMLAILGGAMLGGVLLDSFGERLWACGEIYIGLAAAGFLASLLIRKLPAKDPTRRLRANVFAELREPLVLHFYDDCSYANVAETLGCPKSTAQSRIQRGLGQLREVLAGCGCAVALPALELALSKDAGVLASVVVPSPPVLIALEAAAKATVKALTPAALKLLLRETPRLAERFRREALVTARLDHPGIPPVYESGRTSQGQNYLLMRYVQGESMSESLDRLYPNRTDETLTGLSASADEHRRTLLAALVRAAEAVAYAHSRG